MITIFFFSHSVFLLIPYSMAENEKRFYLINKVKGIKS